MSSANIKHKFYIKSISEQNTILLRIGMSALLLILLIIFMSIYWKLYVFPFVSIQIILSILAPFIDTPTLERKGDLIYFSPLFIIEKVKKNVIKMHGGTLLDYIFVIDRKLNGVQRTNLILLLYIQGLLKLLEKYENSSNQQIILKGTSYIINTRTAKKIGLKQVKSNFIQNSILILNYIPLSISYSYSKAKLTFPNLRNIKTFEAKIEDIRKKKEFLKKLEKRLLARL